MKKFYSSNRAVQILIYLLKANNIKKVIVSPGTTNIEFVGSIQNDPYFQIYSSVDERSAAYIACGMAAESQEPVVLSCTGATASRNYFSGLTEAYYRQLPILAITSTQPLSRTECYSPQFIDRTIQPRDTVKLSVQIGQIHSDEDAWSVNRLLNKAILELTHDGDGPVHINLETGYSKDFSIESLPKSRVIKRISYEDNFPSIDSKHTIVYIGSHLQIKDVLKNCIEKFCEKYNGVVICDHSSNYHGKYKINASLLLNQDAYKPNCRHADLIIDIGSISGAEMNISANQVWRVNPDGLIRDRFHTLKYVFQMSEEYFFNRYTSDIDENSLNKSYYQEWNDEVVKISKLGEDVELPFSNTWIARETIKKIPSGSIVYLGVLNSIRNWNFFEPANNLTFYTNTGGFGIDGMVSSLLGTSIVSPDKLIFGILGDLSFFYDMNTVGNRHAGNNIRLLVINNGRGTEFTNYNHPGATFGKDADKYIAAAGHFGNKSKTLIKHYAEDLGYEYLSANSKQEYLDNIEEFTKPNCDHSIIFEVFTSSDDESDGIKIMRNLEHDTKNTTKNFVKKFLGDSTVEKIKKTLNK